MRDLTSSRNGTGRGKGQMTTLKNITQDWDEPTWKPSKLMPLRPYSTSTRSTLMSPRQLFLYLRPENPGILNWDTLSEVDGVVITYWTTQTDGT